MPPGPPLRRRPSPSRPRLPAIYAPEEHPFLTRMYAAGLRELVALPGPGSRAVPGTESYDKLRVLSVVGTRSLH